MVEKVEIGDATLYCGDCLEMLPTLGRVDVTITDPPYGVELGNGSDFRGGKHGLAKRKYESYHDSLQNFIDEIVPRINLSLSLSDRGAIFCNNNLHELPKPDVIGGVYLPSATGRHCWGFNSFSPVSFYGKAPGLNNGSRPSAIRSTELAEINGHPCPKPIGWMKWLVSHASLPGHTVVDPFMGSGTTGVACIQLGRKFIGIERERKYFDIACERIAKEHAQPRFDLVSAPRKAAEQMTML
jgi:site-specific DNA-methyltransferase (adenine-specific)